MLAHELAHIANRDMMVMTAVSLPAMLADGLRSRLISIITQSASSTGGQHGIGISGIHLWDKKNGWGMSTRTGGVVVPVVITGVAHVLLITVSTVTWVLSRAIVAVLSRGRELAADRAAATVLGSPSQLSSALVSLDDSIEEMPRNDLREVSDISAISIVPLEPPTVEPVRLGPDGNRTPFLWSVRAPLRRAKKQIFRTHPHTERRVERLSSLETQ